MTGTMAAGRGNGHANRLRPLVWGGAAGLLLLPAAAMRLLPDAGVDWSGMDFAVMGALLAGACGLYELGARLGRARAYRAGFGLAVLAGFLTVWVNLAVGMLGDEGNPANLLFLGVLAIAALCSALARFKPAGMAKAMFATAAAQLLVVGIASAWGGFAARDLALTACFALPWLLAGALFRGAMRAMTGRE
jgi:hypothetical protein